MWKLWVLLICICLIPCLWRFNHHIWTMESFSSWMLPLGCDKINLLESISKLTTSLDKIMYGPLTLFVNMCPYLLKYVYIYYPILFPFIFLEIPCIFRPNSTPPELPWIPCLKLTLLWVYLNLSNSHWLPRLSLYHHNITCYPF